MLVRAIKMCALVIFLASLGGNVSARFMGVDPVGFKESNLHSSNRYAYANNNPYRFGDPDGRNPEEHADREAMKEASRIRSQNSGTSGGAANPPGEKPPLSFMHNESVLKASSGNYSSLNKEPTEKIVNSLKPGQEKPLLVDSNGKIVDGNTRVKILQERGVDVDKLPRTQYKREGLGGGGLLGIFGVGMAVELFQAIQQLPPKEQESPPKEASK